MWAALLLWLLLLLRQLALLSRKHALSQLVVVLLKVNCCVLVHVEFDLLLFDAVLEPFTKHWVSLRFVGNQAQSHS
jgi:hypothetical protein